MKRFFLLLLVLLISIPLFADKNYISEKVVFLPQDFYVGDLVEMRVKIRPSVGAKVEKPKSLPSPYWIKIDSADILQDGDVYELRLLLRPYAPGIRTLPTVQFGDISLKDIRIQTKSVLAEESHPFSPPAEQMLLPGTGYYIGLLIGLLFILPLCIIIFGASFKNKITDFINEKRQKRPYKRIMNILKDLSDKHSGMTDRELLTIIVDELRIYLSARGSIDYSSATVKEASAMVLGDFKEAAKAVELIPFFRLADEIKFGDGQISSDERLKILADVNDIVEEIDFYFFGGHNDVDI
ncbi:MAG: hypothetical protein PQJ46_04890 [Spirochaetales bacterium]|nr:hypothetical protein [Spirochaetales bacterium]